MKNKSDIGIMGLAVMGQNLALNINDKGFSVSIFNRSVSRVDEVLSRESTRKGLLGTHSLEEFVASLKRPRRVMLMVKAGRPVDEAIDSLVPFLDQGDIIIDGGNSHFSDSTRRKEQLEQKGILFIGTGVSGGEEGARYGPSIMPGGSAEAWPHVKDIFQAIAAKGPDGTPCCDWIGPDGSGHFVKMVHNGIEYGDMQLIAEVYHLMKVLLGLDYQKMKDIFSNWNRGVLDSYLIEITAHILGFMDDDGKPLVEKILDSAGQKGTGRWTVDAALELGVPLTLIDEAVQARSLSARKEERMTASRQYTGPQTSFAGDIEPLIHDLELSLYAAKIVSYTQGFMLMKEAAERYGWHLDYGSIALMWREGCIIRSVFLDRIKVAYVNDPGLNTLLLDPYFKGEIEGAQQSWRRVVSAAVQNGIPVPALSGALSFFDGYRSGILPANLIQAQRDYFGAHTYERVDAPRGKFFHTDWTGTGGKATSSGYKA